LELPPLLKQLLSLILLVQGDVNQQSHSDQTLFDVLLILRILICELRELERIHFTVRAALMLHSCPQVCYCCISPLWIFDRIEWLLWLPDWERNTEALTLLSATALALHT